MKQSSIRVVLLLALCVGFAVPAALAGTTYSTIEQKTGWQTCSTCAGAGGSGPSTPHSMKQFISSPSLDGKSAQFNVGGSTPYANAIWWKQLGANGSVSHFTYDLWYYVKNPTAIQALEFDVNQTLNSRWYVFGTECVMKGTPHWDVYDAYNHAWRATSIPCRIPKAYTWTHIVLQVARVNGKMQYVSVTQNGSTSYFNRSYSPKSASTAQLNVAFQMDENGSATDYSVWLDKVTLKAW